MTRKKGSKWLDTPCIQIFLCADSNGTGFEAVHSDVSELWAIFMHYIILQTVHHRSTFRIFCNITQKTAPNENSCKMFHISSAIVLLSYGKVKDIFLIRIKFCLGRGKRKGYEERPKMRCFFKIPIIN